jgi:hypothetical protein
MAQQKSTEVRVTSIHFMRNAGFDVLTVVTRKSTIFWDVTPMKSSGCPPVLWRSVLPPSSTSKSESKLSISYWLSD